MNRLEMIRSRMDDFVLNQLHAAIATPTADAWLAIPIPVKYRVSGWLPPLPYTRPADEGETVLMTVCPEVIVEHTAWLDDEELEAYLKAVEMFMAMHVAHYPEYEGDPEGIALPMERERLAEDALYDANPEALRLYSEVQARALDTQ